MKLAQWTPSTYPQPYYTPVQTHPQACPTCPPVEPWMIDPFNILLITAIALALAWLMFRTDKPPADPTMIPATTYEGGVCNGFSMRVQYPSGPTARGETGGDAIRAYTDRRFSFHIEKAIATRFKSTVKLEMTLTSSGGLFGPLDGAFMGVGPYGEDSGPGSADDRADCFAYVVGYFTVKQSAVHRRPATMWRKAQAFPATTPTRLQKACLTVEFHRDLHDKGALDLDSLLGEDEDDAEPEEMIYPGTAATDVTLTGWGTLPGELFVPQDDHGQRASTFLLTFYAGVRPPAAGAMEPTSGGFGGGMDDLGGGGGGGGAKSLDDWAKTVENLTGEKV